MASMQGKPGNGNGSVGAAAVIGAGITGMQAALDLAEAGIKVYLVERAPAIGGTMAMLDKTFPTNDCAMCIMSPKLVEVSRHLNIELIDCAEVSALDGVPGDFVISLKQHPRYVDREKCTGCGDCAAACPISLPDEFNGGLSQRKAIYKLYPQAVPNAYAIQKQGVAPCRDACPIHQRAQGYLALTAEGRFADAYRTILEDNPFPSICGRVCNHKCEQACNRAQIDGPLNVMGLKRFIADWAWEHRQQVDEVLHKSDEIPGAQAMPLAEKRVAVVGSGPAGLTCARDLARLGSAVTVYEALPVPGGMLRVGLPAHRLPPAVVQREIDAILSQGIELKLNHPVDEVEALLETHDAVFVAIGAHGGVKLPITGNQLPDVLLATDFLRQVNLWVSENEQPASEDDHKTPPGIPAIAGKRVLVLGGGNVAIDAAMTAVRLGAAWVGMTCLESREQMPAHEWEISEALEEDIEIFPSRTFKEVTDQNGAVTGVRTAQVIFRGFVNGRPDFDELAGTEQVIPADVVIFAIGQRPQSGCLKKIQLAGGGRVEVDGETLATSVPGIYAGGDAVTGTAFIVDAIAAGHRAARSIAAFLDAQVAVEAPGEKVVKLNPLEAQHHINLGVANASPRHDGLTIPPQVRKTSFTEFHLALSKQQARAEAARCLHCGVCSECNQCVYACRASAIQHGQVEKTLELKVGAVVLAPGVEAMPGEIRPEYGYGRYPNVVTSVQFERMLSASGPFEGIVKRPSDGAHPHKIAWIQCVGSRDCRDGGDQDGKGAYCSSVCCMYATKEAMIAREHDPQIQPTIFYMDIRSFGKGFDAYIDRAKTEQNIRYIRCMISTVKEVPGSHNLRLRYITYQGETDKRPKVNEEEFDLVVLSVGLRPSQEAKETARRVGVRLNEHGFVETRRHDPTSTSRAGVFAAGAFTEPKDIPESVIEASCAAAQVSALLKDARRTLTLTPTYPPERDIADEPPRVGVFVCHCGINIGAVVNTPKVVEDARALPGVVYSEHNLYTCSQDTQARIREKIIEHKLNRVVVASCTPRTHEPLFQDTLRQSGLNPHLFEMANIREQDSWVHRSIHEEATEKARQLVSMAVAKASRLNPITRNTFQVDPKALVIGGGLAGMTAACSIARQGFGVYLVEREAELGGNLRHIYTSLPGEESPQALLHTLKEAVMNEPLIQVLAGSQLVELSGYTGQYRSLLRGPNEENIELQHGALVVATGGREIPTDQYLLGQDRRVLSQRQLEERLQESEFTRNLADKTIVMIQCVGSRDEEHPYCSRLCCTEALKNALQIKQHAPQARVVILFRDLRSYGFREGWYRQARQAGVIFLEYDQDQPPSVQVRQDQALQVEVMVQPENAPVRLAPDWLVLSVGVEPNPDNGVLGQLLKVPVNETGFFLEAHVKLRPVDFAAEGIFLCGLAHSPRDIKETMAQAQAAAVRVAALLSKPKLEAIPTIASVNPRLCTACGLCVEVCPYGARVLEPDMTHAEVIEVLCQGCGACVAACPNKASQQKGFELIQELAMIDAASF